MCEYRCTVQARRTEARHLRSLCKSYPTPTPPHRHTHSPSTCPCPGSCQLNDPHMHTHSLSIDPTPPHQPPHFQGMCGGASRHKKNTKSGHLQRSFVRSFIRSSISRAGSLFTGTLTWGGGGTCGWRSCPGELCCGRSGGRAGGVLQVTEPGKEGQGALLRGGTRPCRGRGGGSPDQGSVHVGVRW